MHFTQVVTLIILLGCLSFGASVRALAVAQDETEPSRPIIPMVHAKWLVKDGVPPNIRAMAQTPDGWIWLASSVGLFRFDGVSFRQYEPPPGVTLPAHIQRIGVLADGTLWVSPAFGDGLYFIRGESLKVFDSKKNGVPHELVENIVQDADGNTWIGAIAGLFRLDKDGQTWRNACKEPGAPEHCKSFADIFVDSRGTMWLKAAKGVFARRRGAAKFERVADTTLESGRFREAPDGSVWLSDIGQMLSRVHVERVDPRHDILMDKHDGVFVHDFIIDRQGNFWFPTSSGGVVRAEVNRQTPEKQAYTRQQGLSGQSAVIMLEDKEGNIWVATESGLDQFRPSRMTEVRLPPTEMEGRALAAGPDGQLWADRFFLRSADAKPVRFSQRRVIGSYMYTLYRDPKGVIWEGRSDGIFRLEGGVETRIPRPPELRRKVQLAVFSMVMDRDGALWVSLGQSGSWRYKDGAWSAAPGLAGQPTTTIALADDGALWFGSLGSFAILKNGRVRTVGAKDGLDLGGVMQIVPRGSSAYLGGENGLAFFDGRRVTRIKGDDNEAFSGVSGLALAADGKLWANTGHGLIGIAAKEIQQAIGDPAYRVRYQRFDENDGLTGVAPPMLPLPSMVWNSMGELVITTTTNVFRFDPARHPTNPVIPAVHITAISDGTTARPPRPDLTLVPAPDTVRIDYTALSLSLPQRVRFRYKLEGVDQDWQDAGGRRSVFYTQLAPGHYTFRVIAANNDGLWNTEGDSLGFDVPPTLTQTIWFKLACALAVALLAWGAYRLRLRSAMKRLTMTLEARAAERERIARDLHDTLLQSVQGLLLVFENIARRTPDNEPTKRMMNDALAVAVQVVEEGRDKVQVLRHVSAEGADLEKAFRDHARQLSAVHPAEFQLRREGQIRELHHGVYDELLAVGREAIRNAFVHAKAGRIGVDLAYRDEAFELTVRDNGRGIDPIYRHGRPRHWGISGMRERIAHIGATCDLSSTEDQGTVWHFRLDAAVAYPPEPADVHAIAVDEGRNGENA